MPTLKEDIAQAEENLAALRQRAIEETQAPISKQLVDDVMNGVVSLNPPQPEYGNTGEPPVDRVKMKGKGIAVAMDPVDGQWCVVTLPIGAPGPDNAFLHGFAAELLLCKGQRIDMNGDAGPMEIRCHHKKVARLIYDYEGRL